MLAKFGCDSPGGPGQTLIAVWEGLCEWTRATRAVVANILIDNRRMSSKAKPKLEKCREHIAATQKALLEHKDEVDYDFIATTTKLLQFFDNELKYARFKDRVTLTSDASNPLDRLLSVLAEYEENIKKIVKDKRVRRVMQSTRVRKKLDQLNNSAYRLARTMQQQVQQAETASASSSSDGKKDKKKEKEKAKKKDKSGASTFAFVTLADPEAKRMWEDSFPGEVRSFHLPSHSPS